MDLQGLADAVREARVEVRPGSGVQLGTYRGNALVHVACVATREQARQALEGGADDVLVWPDDRGRLPEVLLRAGRLANERHQLAAYRAAFRRAPLWQEITTADAVILDVSDGFEDSAGYARHEAVGRTPASLFRSGTHSPAFFRALHDELSARGEWRGDLLGRRRDGSLAVLDAHVAEVREGGAVVAHVAIKREAGVQRGGALQSWIEERAAAPWALVRSVDGVVIECTPTVADVFGIDRDALVGASLTDLVPVDLPGDGGETLADHWIGDRAWALDARSRWVGDARFVHVVFTEITARKLEAEQREAAVRDLRDARDQALAADRAKSAFLAGMSHDLRNPLNAILGYSELVEESVDDPVIEADLQRIQSAGRHLLSLVDDVLDLARIEAGAIQVSVEDVDPEDLLLEVVSTARLRAAKRGIDLRVECDGYPLRSDRHRLLQILTNLVGNAVKYAVPGRVTLGAVGGHLYVEDEGPGLDAAQQALVFEPFQRLHQHGEGAGLGLALCRRFAEALGGTLSVTSAPGQGSRFTLELPEHCVIVPGQRSA
ncbi:MAG: PAS domain-containing sensor histidine kinase [Myxococcota bacterium]